MWGRGDHFKCLKRAGCNIELVPSCSHESDMSWWRFRKAFLFEELDKAFDDAPWDRSFMIR